MEVIGHNTIGVNELINNYIDDCEKNTNFIIVDAKKRLFQNIMKGNLKDIHVKFYSYEDNVTDYKEGMIESDDYNQINVIREFYLSPSSFISFRKIDTSLKLKICYVILI